MLKQIYDYARRNNKHNCECGGKYSDSSKSVHIKTKLHINYFTNDPVIKIELREAGEVVEFYDRMIDAEKDLGIPSTRLNEVIKGKKTLTNNFSLTKNYYKNNKPYLIE